ncbi:MAG: type IX secretion system membrane protein PorP/SprF [Vicingaceae bacterium]|nr:type IX secretion system membrane protein PorP/SprF [Vicingaceae bacterium]
MKKLFFITAFITLISVTSKAQQDPLVSQYMFNGLFLNPAYAGSHPYWTSTLTYRNQWVGFDGAPETGIAAIDGPLPNENMGLGVILIHDKIGVTRQNTMVINYAYSIKINDISRLAFGINAGFSQYSQRLSDLKVWDDDVVFEGNTSSKVLPKFGAGAYYYANKYYLGFSVPTLFAYQNDRNFHIDVNRSSFLRRHYMLTGGYVFDVGGNFKLKPSFLGKYVISAPFEMDINLSAIYKDTYWLGVSYRTGDAIAFIAEYQTNKAFRVGYSYDLTLSDLNNYSYGSHEIMIGIDFGKDLAKVKTPRFF